MSCSSGKCPTTSTSVKDSKSKGNVLVCRDFISSTHPKCQTVQNIPIKQINNDMQQPRRQPDEIGYTVKIVSDTQQQCSKEFGCKQLFSRPY